MDKFPKVHVEIGDIVIRSTGRNQYLVTRNGEELQRIAGIEISLSPCALPRIKFDAAVVDSNETLSGKPLKAECADDLA